MAAPRLHPHPIAVHFSNGLLPVALLFELLYWLHGGEGLYLAGSYVLYLGSLGILGALLTGLLDWRRYYRQAWVPVFKHKLWLSIAALLCAGLACLLRLWYGALLPGSGLYGIYLGLLLLAVGCVIWAGYLGGRLVFH